jgi:hypothetical protein
VVLVCIIFFYWSGTWRDFLGEVTALGGLSKYSHLEDNLLSVRRAPWRKTLFPVRDNCWWGNGEKSEVLGLETRAGTSCPNELEATFGDREDNRKRCPWVDSV